MLTRPIGNSGIESSVVGMGAYAIGGWGWGGTREKEAVEAIHAAIDNGVTLIDTAPVYGFGRSEEILGKALLGGRRHGVVLASKCGLVWDSETKGGEYAFSADAGGIVRGDHKDVIRVRRNNRPAVIRRDVEASLKRLRTDYLDLVQTHWQDPTTPIEDTMQELMRLKKEGKIRAIGCCNARVEDLDRYRAAGELDSDQEKFSLLDREQATANLPYCRKSGMAFLAYSPLSQGLLTGTVGESRQFGQGDGRAHKPRFSPKNKERVVAFLAELGPLADYAGLSLPQAAVAWTLAQTGCTHALVGMRSVRQAAENAGAGGKILDSALSQAITELATRHFPENMA